MFVFMVVFVGRRWGVQKAVGWLEGELVMRRRIVRIVGREGVGGGRGVEMEGEREREGSS